MSGKVYIEKLADPDSEQTISREPVDDDHMWIIFVLEDGQEIRVQNDLDNIYVNSSTGTLAIRPEAFNAIRVRSGRDFNADIQR